LDFELDWGRRPLKGGGKEETKERKVNEEGKKGREKKTARAS